MNPQQKMTQPEIQTFGLYDYVKQKIYDKFLQADAYLQLIHANAGIKPINEADEEGPDPGDEEKLGPAERQFVAAVLAEYRLVRAKLHYQIPLDEKGKIKEDDPQSKKIAFLYQLDDNILGLEKNYPQLDKVILAHLVVGEFLELDGITKFEKLSYSPTDAAYTTE